MKSSKFKKAERLGLSAAIQTVFRKGKKYSCNGAKLFVLPNGTERNRVVFTFPRGYGTAVERNRSRRMSREAYRQVKGNLVPGHDLAILVFPGMDSFSERMDQYRILFGKAGLWVKP